MEEAKFSIPLEGWKIQTASVEVCNRCIVDLVKNSATLSVKISFLQVKNDESNGDVFLLCDADTKMRFKRSYHDIYQAIEILFNNFMRRCVYTHDTEIKW